jgi:tRNA-dihydrouridine synthase
MKAPMTYEEAVQKIQATGTIQLSDLKELNYDDLYELVEEIKKWCVYANGDVGKMKKIKDKKKKKNKK